MRHRLLGSDLAFKLGGQPRLLLRRQPIRLGWPVALGAACGGDDGGGHGFLPRFCLGDYCLPSSHLVSAAVRIIAAMPSSLIFELKIPLPPLGTGGRRADYTG